MKFVDIETQIPSYFAGSAGMETVRKLKELIAKLKEDGGCLERYHTVQEAGFHGRCRGRFSSLDAHGARFLATMDVSDAVAFAITEPDFDHYYWTPDNRGQVASLIVAFYSELHGWSALRIVSVHADGRIVGIHDFGGSDLWLMPNNIKYANVQAALRQHAKNHANLLPERV